MVGVVIHIYVGDQDLEQGLISDIQDAVEILKLYQINIVVLAECTSVTATVSVAHLESVAKPFTRCIITQPSQAYISLRAAIDQFRLPASQVAIVSISPFPSLQQAATSLGCQASHFLPQSRNGWVSALLQHTAIGALQNQLHAPSATTTDNSTTILKVGYLMKPKRELALHRSGMLSLLPQDGICCFPLTLHLPVDQQPPVDIVLHKITDFIKPISSSTLLFQEITSRIQQGESTQQQKSGSNGFLQYLKAGGSTSQLDSQEAMHIIQGIIQHDALDFITSITSTTQNTSKPVVLIDALPSIAHVVDRTKMTKVIEAASTTARKKAAVPAGCPPWIPVDSSFGPEIVKAMRTSGIDLPCIVKPRIACGVEEAHYMAFVLHSDAFKDLEVPIPAIVQAYSDHGGVVWKVYVAGDKVFTMQKKSTPNLSSLVSALASSGDTEIPTSIHFDSLHSLPVSLPRSLQVGDGMGDVHGGEESNGGMGGHVTNKTESLIRPEYLETLAMALKDQLKLTFFGFDVVFDSVAGEVRVVDVNYFPSFSGVDGAPLAFREAIKRRYNSAVAAHV